MAYKDYLAVQAHYTRENYDYFKFNGKVRVTPASYDKRNDKIFFEKLGKRPDCFDLIVANQAYEGGWIGNVFETGDADLISAMYRKRKQSLSYVIEQDLKALRVRSDFKANFKVEQAPHPPIFQQFIEGEVTLETISVIANSIGIIPYWDKMMTDPLWNDSRLRIIKHHRFLDYRKEKVLDIVRKSM
jgi:hypothetical protein